MNHAKKKREVAEHLYQSAVGYYRRKGTKPNCIAGIEAPIREAALELAQVALKQGYIFSKTQYPFAELGNTRDIFLTAAAKLFMEREAGGPLWPA